MSSNYFFERRVKRKGFFNPSRVGEGETRAKSSSRNHAEKENM
jgi:hypothetical protein